LESPMRINVVALTSRRKMNSKEPFRQKARRETPSEQTTAKVAF
jgi:hypothetical protein